MHSYGFSFFHVLQQMNSLAIIGGLIVCGVAAWNLKRARANGAKLMLFGLLLQLAHSFAFLLIYVSMLSEEGDLPGMSIRLYLYTIANGLSMIGILCFAIGFFLHAKKQRGLQTRVEELERILEDRQQRAGH